MGHLQYAASTSSIAASDEGGALTTISTISQKDPQLHWKCSMSISALMEVSVMEFCG